MTAKLFDLENWRHRVKLAQGGTELVALTREILDRNHRPTTRAIELDSAAANSGRAQWKPAPGSGATGNQ